jgi:hypothetical protein
MNALDLRLPTDRASREPDVFKGVILSAAKDLARSPRMFLMLHLQGVILSAAKDLYPTRQMLRSASQGCSPLLIILERYE